MPAVSPRYTIDMLDAMPQEPGARYELVDGFLIVTPGEIRFGRSNSLQPDVLVYPSTFPLTAPWEEVTEWWLAVEVVSLSSREYDREEKRVAYLKRGVPVYWVVDPKTRTVEVWHTDDRQPRIVRDRLLWTAPGGHRVEIELEELFRDIPREM